MIAAIYARKSTDDSDRNEEARSTTRQVERATEYAHAKGWTVDPRFVFVDDAVSGAEWKHRDGWNALLAALEPRPPFGVLVVSELSRIGRDTVRTPAAVLALEEAGVEVRSYLSDAPITLADESGEISTVFNSLAASFERRRARQRTRDSLERRARAGAATGRRTYGYQHARNGDGYVHQVVDEAEAAAVRQAFALYADGASLAGVARALTARGVPPPPQSPAWSGGAVRDLLRRTMYRGEVTWGKRQAIMRGGTAALKHRAEADWITAPAPGLRIVDDDLWARVHERLGAVGATFARRRDGRLLGRPSGEDVESRYLLSGIAACSICGASLVGKLRGPDRTPYYGCVRRHKAGPRGCRNGLLIRQDVLDAEVLGVLVRALDPKIVAEAVRGAVADLQADRAGAVARRAAVAADLGQVAARERRLLDALVDGDGTAEAIRGRLREELARRDALTAELTRLDLEPAIDGEKLAQDVAQRAQDVRAVLGRHVAQARQIVRLLLVDRLVCEPCDDAGGRGYAFRALGTYRKLGVPAVERLGNHGGHTDACRVGLSTPPARARRPVARRP